MVATARELRRPNVRCIDCRRQAQTSLGAISWRNRLAGKLRGEPMRGQGLCPFCAIFRKTEYGSDEGRRFDY